MRWLAFPKMALGLILAVLALLALGVINEAGYRQSSRSLADIGEAQRTRAVLMELLQTILDAETGQRGYLLTGETRYRQPYDAAIKLVDSEMTTLRQLYDGQPAELARLTTLQSHVARKLSEMTMSVRLREEGNDDAWKFVITTDIGREEMDAIRLQTGELIGRSDAALTLAQEHIASSQRFARIGIAVVALAALLAFYLYLREIHKMRSADEGQQSLLKKERNALENEVRERTATLAELATHLQDVRETERGYLARELHDELGSLLTAAKLDVARLKSRLAELPDAALRLQHLNDLLNSGIALKRRIIEDLRPSSLSNLGLVASLEILGREFAERSGLEIEMKLEPVELDEANQLTVYRMVQEGLTNIGKYANARQVVISMKRQQTDVMIEVRDDGDGFDTELAQPSAHGLAGMRHRVDTAKGKLVVSSEPGVGTQLKAQLPVQSQG